jgi:hypothetical protein
MGSGHGNSMLRRWIRGLSCSIPYFAVFWNKTVRDCLELYETLIFNNLGIQLDFGPIPDALP